MLSISEIFHSLQGEGIYAGVPSSFIRLYGCNLACTWCDTPYASRPPSGSIESSMLDVAAVVAKIERLPEAKHVVVTGGEPMLQPDVLELATNLTDAGHFVTVETNGTYWPDEMVCHLASLSPKLPGSQPNSVSAINTDCLNAWCRDYMCQLKFVIRNETDIQAALSVIDALSCPPPREQIFLMPEACTLASISQTMPTLVESCKQTGLRYGMRLQLLLFGNRKGT